MASTIDFSTLDDQELLYGYQRVNRSRFPENFFACVSEINRRGLTAPEKFEIPAISGQPVVSIFQKLSETISSTIANRLSGARA